MSFGSSAPDINQQKFFEAFGQLKYTVFWRYKGPRPAHVPSNIHLMDWLPQSDLLAHPNVKLFITHCGANGQFEGVYWAVPMLQFPMLAEQHYNAKRGEHHGFGITLRLGYVTSQQLLDAITEVTTNPYYKQQVTRASHILHSRPDRPAERAVYWLEHVITHGADHLMSHSLHMPWYQLLMLDIFALHLLLLAVAILVIMLIIRVCCCACNSKSLKLKTT